MAKSRLLELSALYLAKEISEEEEKELANLLNDEENKKTFSSIAELYNTASKDTEFFDTETAFMKLQQRILPGENKKINYSVEKIPRHRRISTSVILKMAASIIILLGIGTAIYLFDTAPIEKHITTLITKTTQAGQKSNILLSDGTTIKLNSESTLKFPDRFTANEREVYLEGEAYFEVVKNLRRPFIVHTGKISAIVLGTKFNISAFPEDNNITVSLVEGKVKVTISADRQGIEKNSETNKETSRVADEIMLKPDQQLVYDKNSGKSKLGGFGLLKVTGWKDNILIFDNEPLKEVFPKISRAYGVKFIVKDYSQKDRKITTNFKNENIWGVIESIKFATGMEYKTTNKKNELETIVFYNN